MGRLRKFFSRLREQAPLKEVIRKVDGQWCVFSKDGAQRLGCHDSEEAARRQLAAIETGKKEGRHGRIRFVEQSEPDADKPKGSVWDVVLISVGISENVDPTLDLPRFYSRELLSSPETAKMFEGKPACIFEFNDITARRIATHLPDGVDVGTFPKQKVGWYSGVRFGEYIDKDGSVKEGLLAKFHLVDEDLRQPLVEAWESGKKDFLELSINGGGSVVKDTVNGMEVARVEEITVGESVDLVSEGARGGRFLRLVASKNLIQEGTMNREQIIKLLMERSPKLCEGKNLKEMSDEDLGKLLSLALEPNGQDSVNEQEPEGGNPSHTVGEVEGRFCVINPDQSVGPCFDSREEAEMAVEEIRAQTEGGMEEGRYQNTPAPAPAPSGTSDSAASNGNGLTESAVDKIVQKRVGAMLWPREVEDLLKESRLPDGEIKHLRESFRRRVGSRDALVKEIARTKRLLGLRADQAFQEGAASMGGGITQDRQDKIEAAIRASFREARGLRGDKARVIKEVAPLRSLHRAYSEVTGDWKSRGYIRARHLLEGLAYAGYFMHSTERSDEDQKRAQGRIKESLTTGSWAQVLGNALEKERLDVARGEDVNLWRKIVSRVSSTDNIYTKRRIRIGGYGTMPVVTEGADFPAAASPGDQEVTIDLTKKGFTDDITLEMLLRDDLNMVAEIPNQLVRAGMLTLQQDIFDILRNNEALTFDDDTTALFTAGHSNISTNALSRSEVLGAIESMIAQTKFGSSIDRLGMTNIPKILLVDPTQWDEAETIVRAPFRFGTANEFEVPSNIQGRVNEVVVMTHSSDTNDWFLANPDLDTIEVVFVEGQEEPEIFVQDMPNVGTVFNADKVTYKARQWWGRETLDFRTLFGGVVA